MKCKKCKTDAIENYANGKKFFYCRGCKDEVLEITGNITSYEAAAKVEKEIEDWLKYINNGPFDEEDDEYDQGMGD